jgi:hypothetical protein
MKIKLSHLLALAALVSGAGCQKSIHSPATTASITSVSKGFSTTGIGGYDLSSINDRMLAIDYTGASGENNYIFFYRPGANLWGVLKNTNNVYTPVVVSTSGGIGMPGGTYQFTSAPTAANSYNDVGGDHVIAFDYSNQGINDHLVIYRPGTGIVQIMANNGNGTFTQVFSSTTGIGGYDMMSVNDKIISFDYDHTGHKNYLVCYRPGSETIWIIGKSVGGVFSAVVKGTHGIGGFDLSTTQDQVLALDYDQTGKEDHLVLYRPGVAGHAAIWLVQHTTGTTFTTEFSSQTGLPGFGFDLTQPQDRMFAYNYGALAPGRNSALFCYRPGSGLVSIYIPISTVSGPSFTLAKTNGGGGLAGYPFQFNPTAADGWVGDRAIMFNDQNGLGNSSFIAYAPGTGWVTVVTSVLGMPNSFVPVF